jgi:hypothetical protein
MDIITTLLGQALLDITAKSPCKTKPLYLLHLPSRAASQTMFPRENAAPLSTMARFGSQILGFSSYHECRRL